MILTGHVIRAHIKGKPRASGDDPRFADYTNVWVE